MVLRALALSQLVALASLAPLQCGHTSDPELQLDETPGDALWKLAQRFEAAHDAAGEKRTLEYLVEQYPASRWASPAREKLAQLGGAGGGSAGEGGS
ncbi:MAG TPA: hypothetical protein VF765_05410 [Polyangiaceae bacterium]